MKPYRTFPLILVLLMVCPTLMAQRGVNVHDHLLIRDYKRYMFGAGLEQYDGSPYLSDTFAMAYVYQDDLKFIGVPMRLNVFADVMEFKHEGKIFVLEPDPRISRIDIGGERFTVKSFQYLAKSKPGFLEVLKDGKVSLFAKKLMNYREKDDLHGISAKFARLPDTYYFQVENGPVQKVGRLKELLASFPSHATELAAFAKAEKISMNDRAELLRLFEYYTSLSASQ